jgi:dihydropyrimidinase
VADLVVRGGTVVTEGWSGKATVLITDGRIAGVYQADDQPANSSRCRVVDADGGFVLPGGVDPHVHVGMHLGDYATRDDYATATRSAVFGGTTTIIDFALPGPGESPAEAVSRQRRYADGQAWCDYALHGCVTGPRSDLGAQLRQLARAGVPTVKLFTTYRDQVMVNEDIITEVMGELRRTGGMALVHAEANHLIEAAQAQNAARGAIAAPYLGATRPVRAETASVAWILAIAETFAVPVYFVHLSTPAAVDLTQAARRRGVAAFAETCTHYLILDDSVYLGPHPERYVCCPPLRGARDRDGLVGRTLAGQVDSLGSDHCCYDSAQKLERADDVRVMPNGLPGVETRLPLLLSELVFRRGLPLESFVAMTATNPARLNGLYPRKGTIAPGSDADLVVWRWRSSPRLLSQQDLHMATDFTPYEGLEVMVEASQVVLRGELTVDDGQLVRESRGRFVPGVRWSSPTGTRFSHAVDAAASGASGHPPVGRSGKGERPGSRPPG